MALNLSDSTPLHHPMSQPRFCHNFDVAAVCFPARNPIILLPRCSFYFRHPSGIRLAVIQTSLVHNLSVHFRVLTHPPSIRHSIVLLHSDMSQLAVRRTVIRSGHPGEATSYSKAATDNRNQDTAPVIQFERSKVDRTRVSHRRVQLRPHGVRAQSTHSPRLSREVSPYNADRLVHPHPQ
jgi:hypothetical protein